MSWYKIQVLDLQGVKVAWKLLLSLKSSGVMPLGAHGKAMSDDNETDQVEKAQVDLEQDEINALLSEEGSVGEAKSGSPRLFDFNQQEKIIRGRMPALDIIHDRFIRNFKFSLYNRLRKTIDMTVKPVKIIKYGEYLNLVSSLTSFNVVQVPPLLGNALFVFDRDLVFSMVDSFFGGNSKREVTLEKSEFTPAEHHVIKSLLDILFKDLKDAWSPIFPVQFEFVKSEENPKLTKIVNANDPVIVSSFTIELESGEGEIHFLLPFSMIEPIKDILNAGAQSDSDKRDSKWGSSIKTQMMDAEVEVRCVLADIDVKLKDLVKFKEGSVLNLDMPECASILVGNTPILNAKFGVHHGKNAVKILSKVEKKT